MLNQRRWQGDVYEKYGESRTNNHIRRSDTIASFFICMKEKDVLVLTFFDTGRHSDLFDM